MTPMPNNPPTLRLVRPDDPPRDRAIRLLSPCEVGALLRISTWSVYRAIRRGDLPAVRCFVGGWRLGRVGDRWATVDELGGLFPVQP